MPSIISELFGSRRTWISRTGHHGRRCSRKSEHAPVLTNFSSEDYSSILPGPEQTHCSSRAVADKHYLSPAGSDGVLATTTTDKIRLTVRQKSAHLPTYSPTSRSATTATTGICLQITNRPRHMGTVWSQRN